MQSTELMLDVTKATGLDEKVEIAATLHLPDKLPEGPVQLLLAIHGGGYRRSYWDPGYAGPEYSFARWFTQRGKAVVAIDMLGMGDSSRPEPESKLTHAMIAAAHADALAQVVARFDREVQFVDGEGKVLVSALTRWVMLDRETTRPARITAEIAAPFRSE